MPNIRHEGAAGGRISLLPIAQKKKGLGWDEEDEIEDILRPKIAASAVQKPRETGAVSAIHTSAVSRSNSHAQKQQQEKSRAGEKGNAFNMLDSLDDIENDLFGSNRNSDRKAAEPGRSAMNSPPGAFTKPSNAYNTLEFMGSGSGITGHQ